MTNVIKSPVFLTITSHNDIFKCRSSYASFENIVKALKKDYDSYRNYKGFNADYNQMANDEPVTIKEYDQYLDEAARLIIETQKGSIGMLQRRFKIGFNRAAGIMDQLEKLGVVGAEIGVKPRDVKMTLDEWIQKLQELNFYKNKN